MPGCEHRLSRLSSWAWRVARGLWELVVRFRPGWGLTVILAVAGPWFVWAGLKTEGKLWSSFFIYHHWQRATGTAEALAARPFWYYLPRLVVDTFPWSIYAAISLTGLLISARRRQQRAADEDGSGDRATLLSACWFIGMLAVLSLVRFKRQDYLLPAYPGLALLVAGFFRRVQLGSAPGQRRAALTATLVLAVLASIVGAGVLAGLHSPSLAARLIGLAPPPNNGLAVQDIAGAMVQRLDRWVVPLTGGALVVMTLGAGGVALMAKGRALAAAGALGVMMAIGESVALGAVIPAVDRCNDPRPFAHAVGEHVPAGRPVIYHRMEAHDLVFYTGRPARLVVASRELRALLEGPEQVYVVLRNTCAGGCQGACIGGCLRRRRQEWPDLHLSLLAAGCMGSGRGEQLALVTNRPR